MHRKVRTLKYGLPNTYCLYLFWHQATQQLLYHQSFFFNGHTFDGITWHPQIATAARSCESELWVNSHPMSGPCEYLSLTGGLELSSSPWNFVQRVLWSIPPIYFTVSVGPLKNSNQGLFSVCCCALACRSSSENKRKNRTPVLVNV